MSELKPYPEYKDSGVESLGHVPSNWRVLPIRRYVSFRNGADYKHVEVVDGGYPVIGSGGEFRRASEFMYNGESVLFGRKGTVDKPLYVNGKFWTVDTMYYTECDVRNLLPRFLYYWAMRVPYDYYLTNTALPSMTQTDLGSARIALPSLSDQQAIASYLDHETAEIDAFIADQKELIALLNERRAATITQAVTRGLDVNVAVKESSLGWQGLVNATWPVVPLKLAGHVTLGKMLQSEQKNESDELRTYMRAANVQPDRLELTDQQQMWFSTREVAALDLRSGDVVVVEGGAGFGRSAFLTHDLDGWAFQNSINRIRPAKGCDGRYVNYVLKAIYASGYMDIVCNKATIPHLTAEKLEALRVPLPSHSEQNEVANYLDYETAEIDAAIADAKEAIELSKERRAALISAAVTGKIDVRNHTTAESGAA